MASSLLRFVVSQVWAVWSLVLLLLVAPASANVQGGDCSASNSSCGNVTILAPFWISPEQATATTCGASGFQVTCQNDTPYLGYYRHDLEIKDIFYGNASLLVADTQKLGDLTSLSRRDCQRYKFPTVNTSSKLGLPFAISPANQELILYNCTEAAPPAAGEGLVERRCGNSTFVARAGGSYGNGDLGSSGRYVLEGCDAIFVPVLSKSGKANASSYLELISDGFLLTWQLPLSAGSNGNERKIALIVSLPVAASLLVLLLIGHRKGPKLHLLICKRTRSISERNIEALIVSHGSLAPKRYKYSEATRIASSLNNKLGEGAYGVVFKGKLDDGRLVAVKFLHDSKGKGDEFLNEVISIGKTSHVNIVSLFGFCLEGSKRALIYEYMPNGSLDKYIYSQNPKEVLGWHKLYTIAIAIARGLEYLHHSCNMRIIHFDIKPQNILLDQDFCPKIADFGLAKLCRTKESKLLTTGARGTVGFIAPEVHSRAFGVVSTKSDVYSYGMMLLEMVGGRKNVKSGVQSEQYFPHWVYDHFGQDEGSQACEVTFEVEGIAKKMSLIGLWCIQILPMHRPTITKVLEMFERGLDELEMPPRQNFSQILEDSAYKFNAEGTSTSSVTRTQALSEVLKIKEMSNSKILQRLPTL